jgi:large subunit ribosomal protein L3
MKRHGFSGQPASHGNSLAHRLMGSSGGSQGSGSRVLPGKRMPGNMGNESVTVKNLKVLHVDGKNGLVVVSGCVPGPKNQVIRIQDALGKPWPEGPMSVEKETVEETAEVLAENLAEESSVGAATVGATA